MEPGVYGRSTFGVITRSAVRGRASTPTNHLLGTLHQAGDLQFDKLLLAADLAVAFLNMHPPCREALIELGLAFNEDNDHERYGDDDLIARQSASAEVDGYLRKLRTRMPMIVLDPTLPATWRGAHKRSPYQGDFDPAMWPIYLNDAVRPDTYPNTLLIALAVASLTYLTIGIPAIPKCP